MSVVPFPCRYRHPLPPDAIPDGKTRHCIIYPYKGRWAFEDQDDGGASLVTGLTKEQAISSALGMVRHFAATMELRNNDPFDGAA